MKNMCARLEILDRITLNDDAHKCAQIHPKLIKKHFLIKNLLNHSFPALTNFFDYLFY